MKNRRILFFGTPDFAVTALQALVRAGHELICVTQPDKPVGRKQALQESPVAAAARKNNLPVLQPAHLDADFLDTIQKIGPFALGIIVAYGKILRQPLLQLPEHGFLNIHASLLPLHRGASPIQSAILAGDAETGVTIMQIDEGLDTGPILAQRRVPLFGTETAGELFQHLAPIGTDLLLQVLPEVLNRTAHTQPQNSANATLTKLFTKDDARIEWNDTAEVNERKVRAFNPEPVAWTMFTGKRLNVLRSLITAQRSDEQPGTPVVLKQQKLLGMACGDGRVLALTQVQVEGKTALDGTAFFHGYRTRVGSVLD